MFISIIATDNIGIDEILIEINGSIHTMVNSGGDFWEFSGIPVNTIGDYPFTIFASDMSNNHERYEDSFEVVDETGHEIIEYNVIEIEFNLQVSVTTTDLSGINAVTFQINGTVKILTEHENNEWILDELYELTPGFYTWTLTVTDNNGNVNEVSGSFTVDPEGEDPGELLGTPGIPGYSVDLTLMVLVITTSVIIIIMKNKRKEISIS